MRKIKTLLFFVLLISFTGCFDNSTDNNDPGDPSSRFKLYGKVTRNNQPVADADVQLGNALNWKTKTDAEGNFVLTGLTAGDYSLLVEKALENTKAVGQKINVSLVVDSTWVGIIDLPQDLNMTAIDNSELAASRIKIEWVKSNDPNFVEYRVYRKDNALVNNIDGELIYTTPNIDELSYVDETFSTGRTNFYRVYAYCKDGKYAATNIMNVQVPEVNLLANGDFEVAADGIKPEFWLDKVSGTPTFRYFERTTESVRSGTYALKIVYNEAGANPFPGQNAWGGMYQSISRANLIPGKEYILSFWERSEVGGYQIRLAKNGNLEDPIINYSVPSGKAWNKQSFTFKIDEATSYVEVWISTKPMQAINGEVRAYVDDVRIIK